ncbi:MAG: ribose 5-phosphate isomerase B [Candidatus Diapherotrites archaeon]
MDFFLGSDHGGYPLKEKVKKWLESEGHSIKDFGCFSVESCDYPEFAEKVARAVTKNKDSIGLLFCGTGIGMSIAANKIKGIRAALLHNAFEGKMAKEHNNANVLCFGGRTVSFRNAKKAITAFLKAEFVGGRHLRRIEKIAALER